MLYATCFTNLGPYHLARLHALGSALRARGDRLVAYELAGSERLYPWTSDREGEQPLTATTLFPGRAVEDLTAADCRHAIAEALDRDRPDAVGAVGYVRPESLAMADWAARNGRPAILMSESGRLDRPRVWWKEAVKRRRIAQFSAALVGGPRHRDYLIDLGMPADRIALGYNAVDNDHYSRGAAAARADAGSRRGLPDRPYFLSVSRFATEKNLPALVRAFAAYRRSAGADPWHLVLCGDGPEAAAIDQAIVRSDCATAIHRPGFLQADALPRWYAHAGAFVLPSRSEPWGLVANEAAACGLPLLVSDRAGCVETLVPGAMGQTGRRFDPDDEDELAGALAWAAGLGQAGRAAVGRRAAEAVAPWGPDRFARGTIEALDLAAGRVGSRRSIAKSA